MTLYAPLNLNLHYVTSSSSAATSSSSAATSSSATSSAPSSSSSASHHQNISSPPIAPTSTSSTSSSSTPSSSSSSSLSTSSTTTTTSSAPGRFARTPPQLSPPMIDLRPDTSHASNNHNNHITTTTTKSVRPPSPTKHTNATTSSPIESTASNNECRSVHLMGDHVASFTVEGRQLLCLPQAFELFLRRHVAGLHTVYTKLRRLGISPAVCNVEQVRSLRGLGAIQPGVNRCKLISRSDFEVLYSDCVNAG
ncbi:unnamed protein product [Lampetra planeri]